MESQTNQAELFDKYFVATRKATSTNEDHKLLTQITFSQQTKDLKVLDLGCGTGNLTFVLAKMVGSRGQVIGVDPDKERIEVARQNNKLPNLTFVEGDSTSFPEDQYNLIFCHYVTNWVEDKETMFKNVSRNLKPAGQFAIVAILQLPSLAEELTELMGAEEKKRIDEIFFFCNAEKYDQLAEGNGFTISLKEEDVDVQEFFDPETTIQSWKGISTGVFDPEKVDKEGLEKFRQKYKGKKMEWKLPVARYILTKN